MAWQSRRDFLKLSAGWAGAFLLPFEAWAVFRKKQPGWLYLSPSRERTSDQANTLLALLDSRSGKVREIPLPLQSPHSLLRLPGGEHVFVVEKLGPFSCVVDLKSGQTKNIEALREHYFYGHSALSNNRKWIYSSEVAKSGKGQISVRDARTLRVLKTFPLLAGANPHELRLVRNGELLAVTLQDPSMVIFLDPLNGKVMAQSSIEENQVFGHITELPNGSVVISSLAYTPEFSQKRAAAFAANGRWVEPDEQPTDYMASSILVADAAGRLSSLASHPSMLGFTCTAVSREKNLVAAFFKDGRLFGVWDAKRGRALLEHHFPEGEKPISVAITPDQSQFVVLTTERKIYLVPVAAPKIIPLDMASSQLRQCIHLAVLKA